MSMPMADSIEAMKEEELAGECHRRLPLEAQKRFKVVYERRVRGFDRFRVVRQTMRTAPGEEGAQETP